MIGRGGIFGIDEKYVRVPWDSFKMAPGSKLLVRAAARPTMDAAPQVKQEKNFQRDFATESLNANAYWAAHLV